MTLFGIPVEPEVQIRNAGDVAGIDKFMFSAETVGPIEPPVKLAAFALNARAAVTLVASVIIRRV